MNLRDIGVLHEAYGHKLWVNPGNFPLILDVVRSQLNRILPPDDNDDDSSIANVRSAFLIIESFIVDAEWSDGSRLAKYWSMRAGRNISEKWELFGALLSADECDVLYEAYNATRPQNVQDTEDDGQKKAGYSPEAENTPEATTTPSQ